MLRKLIVRDQKGKERQITEKNWDLMSNTKDGRGNTRRGWTFVRFLDPPQGKGSQPVQQVSSAPAFVPPEIMEATNDTPKEATTPGVEAANPDADTVEETTHQAVPADDFTKIEGVNKTVAEALVNGGVTTFALLAEAKIGDLNGLLDNAGQGPKKGMVPTWKQKAAQLSKPKK